MRLPTFTEKEPLVLREVVVPEEFRRAIINGQNDYVRAYTIGECTVLVTKEFGKWHLSIAHQGHPKRYPTWDELAEVRYSVVPNDVTMAMLLPPLEQYVNIHEHCFQMIEVPDQRRSPLEPEPIDASPHEC